MSTVRQMLEDDYRVDREIGRGGAAIIFLAEDKSGRRVALKVLRPQLAVTVTADRFLREIEFLTALRHPRIPELLDWGDTPWFLYYVMSLVEGPTLRERLTVDPRLPMSEVVCIGLELLEVLAYAHQAGIVHRDVKPDNVVLTASGAILVDFGIARAIEASADSRLTRSGYSVGTSSYMSPEQIEGHDMDHRSDLYSLGCVLFEALAGRPPFMAEREEMVLRMHLAAHLPDLRALRRDVPPALHGVLRKALQGDPLRRWQTAGEFAGALQSLPQS